MHLYKIIEELEKFRFSGQYVKNMKVKWIFNGMREKDF
jgi:hypothetical protein